MALVGVALWTGSTYIAGMIRREIGGGNVGEVDIFMGSSSVRAVDSIAVVLLCAITIVEIVPAADGFGSDSWLSRWAQESRFRCC